MLRRVKKALPNLVERLMLRFGRRFHLEGIKLVTPLQSDDRAERLREKVATALSLIQAYSPKYYAWIKRFTPNILIFGNHAYRAVYVCELKACDISREYALSDETSPARLAMTLVHEATHGYVDSRGIKYQEDRRSRIERICARAEIAFARHQPDADDLVEEVAWKLNVQPEVLTNEAFLEREIDELKDHGAPQWLVACLAKWRKKQLERARAGKPPRSRS